MSQLAPQVRLGDNQSNRVAVLEAARIALGPVVGISEVLQQKSRKIKLEIIKARIALGPVVGISEVLQQKSRKIKLEIITFPG